MPARSDNFQKFVKKKKGSAIKEEIKQAKKKEKKERAAAINAHYERKRAEKLQQQGINAAPVAGNAAAKTPKLYGGRKSADGHAGSATEKPVPSKLLPSHQPVNPKAPHKPKFQKREETAKGKTFDARAIKPEEGKKTVRPLKIDKNSTPVQDQPAFRRPAKAAEAQMPLNKYIAHAGVCSRRDAAELVKSGKVKVNGTVVTDPGTKVTQNDEVRLSDKKVAPTANLVYILLNKPKDFITTADDPHGRKTVLDLVRTATSERVYPVGRLDRNTSGVLLLTNDGDLAQKLSHPSHEIKKVYEVKLDRPLTKADFEKIAAGVTLEDGFVAPDVIAYADSKDKSIIGIEIHSGRNRIVRRIFEHLKYDVRGLDRVMFAGLTKKDVLRGKWRFLNEKEVRLLKYMNRSFSATKP